MSTYHNLWGFSVTGRKASPRKPKPKRGWGHALPPKPHADPTDTTANAIAYLEGMESAQERRRRLRGRAS